MEFHPEKIETMIYTIRDQRVMLDSDLARLYGVETKVLNQAVRRNLKRFPEDFMFKLTSDEFSILKSQIVTSKQGSGGKQKQPLVFTENGVAMLSGVLNSDRAIQVNIAIMRTFTKLRSFLAMENSSETKTSQLFKVVFEKLDEVDRRVNHLEVEITPKLPRHRKKIGLKES